MEYLLLICVREEDVQTQSPAQARETLSAYAAYVEALQQAGVLRGSARLRPSSMAASVRVASGKTEVLNGPYAETREQLGGYFLIDVPDLDSAIQWASRCPGASFGTVEVRPIWPREEY